MLEEMRALVALEEGGSFVRAADKLCLTPSAVTRMVQRLESFLNAILLDRSVKPPRFTPLGRNVLQQCRAMLTLADEMRTSADSVAEPRGIFRLGVSHALADDSIVRPAQRLREQFPALKLLLWTELSSRLLERLSGGDIDAAIIVTPLGYQPPSVLLAREICRDVMTVTAPREWTFPRKPRLVQLAGRPWVLNPEGCLLRATLLEALAKQGIQPEIVAEVHNIHLQASLVAIGHGLGLLPLRHVRLRSRTLRPLRPGGFQIPMAVQFVQARHLGCLERAARYLESTVREALDG
jgi:DNA-binding transcriptional LysR family regulator